MALFLWVDPSDVEGELLVKFKGGPRGEAAIRAKITLQHEVKRFESIAGSTFVWRLG